jgi:HrpA-like RNA helicase
VAALELLHALGALDLDARLTSPLGTFMAELPLEAPLAKALLVSGELQCSEEMLTVAAMFSVQSPWISQRGEHLALDEAKLRFATVRRTALSVTHALPSCAASKVSAANAGRCSKRICPSGLLRLCWCVFSALAEQLHCFLRPLLVALRRRSGAPDGPHGSCGSSHC